MKIYKWTSPETGAVKYGLDYCDSSGKRVRRIVSTRKQTAEKIAAKITTEMELGEYYDRSSLVETPLRDLTARYRTFFKTKNSYPTECYHLSTIEAHFGLDRGISSIDLTAVEEFREARVSAPHRLAGESNPSRTRSLSSVNRELSCLRRLLNKAVDWKLLRENPVNSKLMFKEPKGRVVFLARGEAGNLLTAAKTVRGNPGKGRGRQNPHLYEIILVALETGMRLGNVLNLKWSEIDFQKRAIYLPKTKSGESLNVPMSSRLAEALAKVPRRLGSDYVFAASNGEALQRIEKGFRTATRKAGIPDSFRFHDLRHTFVSHELDAGVPISTVAKIVGHKIATMTERYAHLVERRGHEAVDSLPAWEQGS